MKIKKKQYQNNTAFFVGEMRLELTTSCPPDKYASQLRYSPI